MARRFYQLTFRNTRPVFFEDFGNILKMSGILVQGEQDTHILLLSPTALEVEGGLRIVRPTVEEWNDIIRQTDDPKIIELDDDWNAKAIHRKQQRVISGAVQQKVFARDNFECQLCGKRMGDVQLTVDHWVPLELGGENNDTNYITACRACNKRKGSIPPHTYCIRQGLDFEKLDGIAKTTVK